MKYQNLNYFISLFFKYFATFVSFFYIKLFLSKVPKKKGNIIEKNLLRDKNKYKNILHINTLANVGGAATIAYKLHLSASRYNYISKMLVGNFLNSDINISEIKRNNSSIQRWFDIAEYYSGYLDCLQLSTFEIKEYPEFKKADIIHLHNLHGNYFNIFALPEITNIKPTIWTLHDMFSFTGHCAHSFECSRWKTGCGKCPDLNIPLKILKDRTHELWQFKQDIYKKSNLTIVCPSKWLKNKVEESILKEKEIKFIPHGINEKIFKNYNKIEARKKLNLSLDKIILLFSSHGGKKNYWKGGEYIEYVYDYFKTDPGILFINIGGNNTEKAQNIIDLEYIDDENILALYYSAADLFIYPTLAETFGLVVIESLSCGTPVITFKTGGVPEIITHMEDGYIAGYKDSNDFINGIEIFIENKKLRDKAGVLGRKKVLRQFTFDRMVNEYFSLYNEIMFNYN